MSAPEVPKAVKDEIAALPGTEGWWKSSGQDTFERLAADLLAHGYTPDEAVDLLGEALGAAQEEYGE